MPRILLTSRRARSLPVGPSAGRAVRGRPGVGDLAQRHLAPAALHDRRPTSSSTPPSLERPRERGLDLRQPIIAAERSRLTRVRDDLPVSHREPVTSELLTNVLDAHGGLQNWSRVCSLSAGLLLGGPFWSQRGWPDPELLTAQLDAQREHITLAPFTAPDRTSVFDVAFERLAIQGSRGEVVGERVDPRSSFPPFDLSMKWDLIEVAYFLSAIWNYLTQPFSFTYPGVAVREIEPRHEDGQDLVPPCRHLPEDQRQPQCRAGGCSPETVEACTMRSSHARDTTEVRPGVS